LTTPEVRVVVAWHEALNGGDVERLVALSHPDVEVGGPRGTGQGAQLLREWVARAGIHLEPRRVFHQGDTVVVEQEAEWRPVETGELSGSQHVASIFVVRDGMVTCVSRYPDLAEALREADLDGSHEVPGDYRTGARESGGEVRKL
jgi:ketosteroid isomerase-like protein